MPYAIGLDLGGTSLKAGLIDHTGAVIQSLSCPIESTLSGQDILNRIRHICQELSTFAQAQTLHLCAIGLGTPGVVDPHVGAVVSGCPNIPGWVNVPFANALRTQFQIPVFAHNDVTIMALGEQRWGAAQGKANAICLTLGTGIGGGIIINHQVYDGASYYAGEVGHMCIEAKGRPCPCGSHGCWEGYASASGLIRTAQLKGFSLPNQALSAKAIIDAARGNNHLAQSIMEDFYLHLGLGIANLINIFNPHAIVIGGGVAQAGEFLFAPLKNIVKSYAMAYAFDHTEIIPAKLGEQAGIIGAATYALDLATARSKQ